MLGMRWGREGGSLGLGKLLGKSAMGREWNVLKRWCACGGEVGGDVGGGEEVGEGEEGGEDPWDESKDSGEGVAGEVAKETPSAGVSAVDRDSTGVDSAEGVSE